MNGDLGPIEFGRPGRVLVGSGTKRANWMLQCILRPISIDLTYRAVSASE
jgi:hypothetical protein